MAIQYLRDCPYFIGPFAPSRVIAKRAASDRKRRVKAEFCGPPKPPKPRKKYEVTGSKFEWAEDIDLSTPEGRKEYNRQYNKRWYRSKTGSKGHQKKTDEEKRETERRTNRRRDARHRSKLTDYFIKKEIRDQYGVKNPTTELIEAKRAQMRITRELRNLAGKAPPSE